MKKLTTLISVVAMMCAVIAALAFSIWAAVYGDSHYRFYKKEYQKYEVTEDLDMNIDHVMYVTEHMMNYLIGKEEKLSVVTTVEGKEQDFFNERDRLHMRDVRNLFLGGIKVGGVCLIVAAAILTMFKKREKDWTPSSRFVPWAELASRWPRPQPRLPVSAAGGGRLRCSYAPYPYPGWPGKSEFFHLESRSPRTA